MSSDNNSMVLHDGRVFVPFDEDGFEGYRPIQLPSAKPITRWKGGKLPFDRWQEVMAFFEWSYEETQSEAMVRMFYNRDTQDWKFWAFPQRGVGMHVQEVENHENWAAGDAAVGAGYSLYGSIHHHCKASAFQSGTDHRDETKWNGIHITIGKIGTSLYDIHSRIVMGEVHTEAHAQDWFELPQCLIDHLPETMRSPVLMAMIQSPPPQNTGFPAEWRANLLPKFSSPTPSSYPGMGFSQGVNHVGHKSEHVSSSGEWVSDGTGRMIKTYSKVESQCGAGPSGTMSEIQLELRAAEAISKLATEAHVAVQDVVMLLIERYYSSLQVEYTDAYKKKKGWFVSSTYNRDDMGGLPE